DARDEHHRRTRFRARTPRDRRHRVRTIQEGQNHRGLGRQCRPEGGGDSRFGVGLLKPQVHEAVTPIRRSWAMTAIAWSLCAASVDVAVSLLNAPADSAAGSGVARSILADAVLFAPLFAIAAAVSAVLRARCVVGRRLARVAG